MAAHRFWRVLILTGGNGSFYAIAELEMATAANGANVCTGGTPVKSGERVGFEATKAFDGIKGVSGSTNCWSVAQAANQYLGYDFGVGVTKDIREIRMWSRGDSFYTQMLQDFRVQYSDDGSTWTTAVEFSNNPAAWAQNETRSFLIPTAATTFTGAATGTTPPLEAKAAFVRNITTGTNYYASNADQPTLQNEAASLAKLMSAKILLAQKSAVLATETATVQTGETVGGSSASLTVGDVLTLRELLYGMIVPSGNDAAEVVARVIGDYIHSQTGSGTSGRTRFLEEMNAQAAALGMTNTSFESPHGTNLSPDGTNACENFTTARDLAILAADILTNSTIQTVATAASHTMTITGANARTYSVSSTLGLVNAGTGVGNVGAYSGTQAAKGGVQGASAGKHTTDSYSSAVLWQAPNGDQLVIIELHSTTDTTRTWDQLALFWEALSDHSTLAGTEPADAHWSQVVLLANAESGYTDLSSYARALANQTASALDTTNPIVGTKSYASTATTGQFTAADAPELSLGSGDFDLDIWLRGNGTVPDTTDALISKWDATLNLREWSVQRAAGGFAFWYSTDGSTSAAAATSGLSDTVLWNGAIRHVKILRAGGTLNIYVNGTLAKQQSVPSAFYDGTAKLMVAGRQDNGTGVQFPLRASDLDGIRLTKGYARLATGVGRFMPYPRPYATSGNTAPTAPTITSPAAGASVLNNATVSFAAATDADGDPLNYSGRYRLNGGSWVSWFSAQPYGTGTKNLPGAGVAGDSIDIEIWANDGTINGPSAARSFAIVALPSTPTLSGYPTGPTSVHLTLGGGTGATSWALYRGTASGFPLDGAHQIATGSGAPSGTDDDTSGLTGDSDFYYVLVASNATGSTQSTELHIHTLDAACVGADTRLGSGWAKRWGVLANWLNGSFCGGGYIQAGFARGNAGAHNCLAYTAAPLAGGQRASVSGTFGELYGRLLFEPYAGEEWSYLGVGVLINGGGAIGGQSTGVVALAHSGPFGFMNGNPAWTPCNRVGLIPQISIDVYVLHPYGSLYFPVSVLYDPSAGAAFAANCYTRPECLNLMTPITLDLEVTPNLSVDPTGKTYDITLHSHGWTQRVSLYAPLPCGYPALVAGTAGGYVGFVSPLCYQNTYDPGTCSPTPPTPPTPGSPGCTPAMDAPTVSVTEVCGAPSLTGSPMAGTCLGNHASTDWQVRRQSDGVVIWSSMGDTTNLERYDLAAGVLPTGITLEVQITYYDDLTPTPTTASSAWTAFTLTGPTVLGPPVINSPTSGSTLAGGLGTLNFSAPTGAPAGTQYSASFSYDAATWIPLYALGSIVPGTNYPLDFTGYPAGQIAIQVVATDACASDNFARVCVTLPATVCSEEVVTITAVRRLELRSDYLNAGGVCEFFIPEYGEPGGATERREDQGVESFTAQILRSAHVLDFSGLLAGKKVLRRVYDDLSWDESRIARISDGREETGEEIVQIDCDGPLTDLQRSLVYRQLYVTGADGVQRPGAVAYTFPLYRQTLADLLAFIIAHGAPSYFHAGTVEEWDDGSVWDLDFDFDTASSALYKLCEKADRRLAYTRDCAGYRLHILKTADES